MSSYDDLGFGVYDRALLSTPDYRRLTRRYHTPGSSSRGVWTLSDLAWRSWEPLKPTVFAACLRGDPSPWVVKRRPSGGTAAQQLGHTYEHIGRALAAYYHVPGAALCPSGGSTGEHADMSFNGLYDKGLILDAKSGKTHSKDKLVGEFVQAVQRLPDKRFGYIFRHLPSQPTIEKLSDPALTTVGKPAILLHLPHTPGSPVDPLRLTGLNPDSVELVQHLKECRLLFDSGASQALLWAAAVRGVGHLPPLPRVEVIRLTFEDYSRDCSWPPEWAKGAGVAEAASQRFGESRAVRSRARWETRAC